MYPFLWTPVSADSRLTRRGATALVSALLVPLSGCLGHGARDGPLPLEAAEPAAAASAAVAPLDLDAAAPAWAPGDNGEERASSAPRIFVDASRGELVVEVGPVDLPAQESSHGLHGAGAGHGAHGAPGRAAAAERRAGIAPAAGARARAADGAGEGEAAQGAVFLPVGEVRVPFAVWLYGFSYELVDGAGRRLPGELLHHLNLIDPEHRELFLPISRRMLAASKETGSHALPWLLFGYPVEASQHMVVAVMLHNLTPDSYRAVRVRVRLKYVLPRRPWPLFAVYPFQLDVGFPAGDKSFDLPPGRSSRSYEGSPAIPGRLVGIGGHVHDHAVALRFEDVTANKVLWEGRPILDERGKVVSMPVGRLYRRFGVRLRADHRYRVTVEYENPTGDTIRSGGMGVVGGVFRPAWRVPWPAADPSEPLYQLDRRHYLQQIRGRYAEIATP